MTKIVQLEIYQRRLGISSIDELIKLFQDSLIITNRTPEFFVDWKKVKQNADSMKIELSLWNSLIGSGNIEEDFTRLIKDYPEVTYLVHGFRKRKISRMVEGRWKAHLKMRRSVSNEGEKILPPPLHMDKAAQ